MRHTMWTTLLLVGALVTFAPTARAQGGEKASEQPLPTDPNELRRLLLTTSDRALRCRAAVAGWKVPFGEDVWLELLSRKFADIDEEEEARYYAVYALARVGSERCLPKIMELMRTPPQVVVDSTRGRVAKHGYRGEAVFAYERLVKDNASRTLEARLASLAPAEQADALARILCDPPGSYATYCSDVMPPQMQAWWIDIVGHRLGERGPRGAAAIARALETVGGTEPNTLKAFNELHGNPDKNLLAVAMKGGTPRERLCNYMVLEFVRRPHDAARTARPSAPPPVDGQVDGDEYLRLLRSAMDPSPELRQAAIRAVRAVAGKGPWSEAEVQVFRLVEAYALIEVEADLVAFIREERATVGRALAVGALASLGTDSAIEFLVQWDGDADASAYFHPARFAARYLAELEREATKPWTGRFMHLSGGVCPSSRAPYVDVARLERVLAIARESVTALPTGQQRARAELGLNCLERGVANVKRVKAQREENR